MTTEGGAGRALQAIGSTTLRYALAGNLLWIGTLKLEDYEVENIRPLVTSSPLFSTLVTTLGEKRLARLLGLTEVTLGALIAAKPFAAKASAVASLATVGMFTTTLSFLATTPGVWQEGNKAPKLSMVGQFLIKDSVFLGAALLTAADSLRAWR